jgi:hypothetical protein
MSMTTVQTQAADAIHSLPYRAVGVCPKAPVACIEGNVKWGVLILLFVAFLIGIGAMLSGRIMHHPSLARNGVVTLVVNVFVAVLLVSGYAVITGIVGNGC